MGEICRVGILLFDEVEVLDFAGPFEVFSIAFVPEQLDKPFLVQTISQYGKMIKARNGLMVQPNFSFEMLLISIFLLFQADMELKK